MLRECVIIKMAAIAKSIYRSRNLCQSLTELLCPSQVILLEMAKFEVFTKSSGMRTHMPKALVVSVLGPQNDHNTNAAKSLRSFAKQLEISGVKVI